VFERIHPAGAGLAPFFSIAPPASSLFAILLFDLIPRPLLLYEKGSVLAWGLGLYYMIFGFMGKYLQIPGV